MGFFYKKCEVYGNKMKKCNSISDYTFGIICARCSKCGSKISIATSKYPAIVGGI